MPYFLYIIYLYFMDINILFFLDRMVAKDSLPDNQIQKSVAITACPKQPVCLRSPPPSVLSDYSKNK